MKCEKCGHQNPRGARYCGYCQRELEQKQGGALFKKYGILIVSCVAVLCVMIIILIQKDESPAQVTEPVGVTGPEETVHIHTWTDATCTAYATCTGCGMTNGLKLAHKWTEGTCLEPGVCEVCGTVSTLSVHQWGNGTPKTCKLCGKACEPTANAEQEVLSNATVESVIRERLPIATYAMTDAEKVYSYSDAALTEQTKQYYFNSRTDEIVILDISEDGSAMYVRYPSSISGTGYRNRWFAAKDIFGELEQALSPYTADEKTKTYKLVCDGAYEYLFLYDVISKGTEGVSLGTHIFDKLIIYSMPKPEEVLDITLTERMALTSPYDQVNRLSVDGYKTFSQYLEYDYSHLHPARILTKEWEDGGIKICFLNKRELFIKLKDLHTSNYPLTYNAVPLTKVNLFAGQDDHTGIEIVFSADNTLQHDEYFTDIAGKQNQSQSFASVQFDYSDGYITMYLALPEEVSWDLYSLTSVFVDTHLDEDDPEEYIIAQEMEATEIHGDTIRKIQSVQSYFSGLDAQGNVLWTHVTQERQDRGQMSGIKYIGYINDMVLYDDNNTIVALDAETGKQLWKRPDFEGIINAKDVGMDGTLYFAGSYAPDLFIVRENGTLIKKIVELDGIDEKYTYVNAISAYDDYLIVGVAQYWDGWEQKYRVDLDDYTCTIISEPQT